MAKPLAEIVIEEALASSADVERAADYSDRVGVPIVVAMVDELGLDEVALMSAIRRHVRIRVGDPASAAPDLEAVRMLGRDVARRLHVVPLAVAPGHGSGRVLEVALADPTDVMAIAEVEDATGCTVAPVLLPLGAVRELCASVYRNLVTEVMVRGSDLPARGSPRARPAATRPLRERRSRPRTERPDGETAGAGDGELVLRHRALLGLLVEKQIITLAEYEEAVASLRDARARQS